MLRDTMHELFQELTTHAQESAAFVEAAQRSVEQAQCLLQQAREHDTYAAAAADLLSTKHRELLDYVSGLPTKPQAFLDKLQRLSGEHGKALRERQGAQALLRERQEALKTAEIKLTIAETAQLMLQRQVQEVIEHLQRLPG